MDRVTQRLRLSLALAAFLAVVLAFAALAGAALYADLAPGQKRELVALLRPRLELVAGLVLLGLGALALMFVVAWNLYAKGALRIAEEMQLIVNANRIHRIVTAGPPEIRALAASANALAEHSEALARDLEAKVAEAKSSVEGEKRRLAALMSELSQGVLVCNADGRILLYNERARLTLGASPNGQGGPSSSLIGLGRSIFAVIDRSLLAHALETVQARLQKGESELNVQFVTTTRAGQLVRVIMAPVVLDATQATDAGKDARSAAEGTVPAISGFVMTLEDVTRRVEMETTRDTLLQSFTEGSRASLANIRAAVEMLTDYPDCEPRQRERFIAVIGAEVGNLSRKLDEATADYADSLKTRWPLEEMLCADIVEAARRRIETRLGMLTKLEAIDDSLWIRADSYSLIQLLTYLAGRLQEGFNVREVRFNLGNRGRVVELDLIWSGAKISEQTLYDWEMDAMRAGGEHSPLTVRDVTERHGAEILHVADKARQRAFFRILLREAKPAQPSLPPPVRLGESRPEFYDFDLFEQAGQSPELDDLPLTKLTYTVIDTETTGLDPAGGDEIVALGAVRIVNNRLLRYETFEQLVDPKRPIGAMSATIHGITHEMLRGQPTIDKALPLFREFCEDTVLVGHNAAFDMRFLQLKEKQTGIRFTQPLLDTLLLSEVLHPQQESHTLEAIAARLGVAVVARHTALGDALVTGEVFLRMMPLLESRGIRTLREAREAARQTLHAKVEY
jgi:DNA polymerase-3 subunit epsilon